MRNQLKGHAALAAALSAGLCAAAPATVLANTIYDDAPPPGEDEIVLDDEVEAAPTPTEDTPPGDFLGDDEGDKDKPAGQLDVPVITPEEQAKLDEQNITVVQRQAFLNVFRKDGDPKGKLVHRIELQPFVGLTINDPFVRHFAVGGTVDFWLTNRMALGLAGTGFIGNTTPAYDRIRFQNGQLLTANKNVWEAGLTFTYEPFYGKISVFNKAMMHWEAYTQIGAGIIQTQVVPRFAALHEPFNNFNPHGNFAIGSRFYVAGLDFMSFNFGVRTWIFPDKFEPALRGPVIAGSSIQNDPSLDDPKAAKDEARYTVSFSATAMFGVSFYLPPTFQYSTRR